jgi:hypothetical protein
MRKLITLITIAFCLSVSSVSAQDTTAVVIQPDIDSSILYGFIPERPINVGDGPSAQRKYLESLRDAKGMRVQFKRVGSCCEHPSQSKRAFMGIALLDKYEITYRDRDNIQQKSMLFLCFYEGEKTKAVQGFTVVESND